MSFPFGPPKMRDKRVSHYIKGYSVALSLVSEHSSDLYPMIFCHFCGWRKCKMPPSCAHCPVDTDPVLDHSYHQLSLKMGPNLSQESSSQKFFQNTSAMPRPSESPNPGSSPLSPGDLLPTCPQLKSQSSPAASSKSVQPAKVCSESAPEPSRRDATPLHHQPSLGKSLDQHSTSTSENQGSSSQPLPPPQPAQPSESDDVETLGFHPCRFCKLSFAMPYLLHCHIMARHKHACNMCRRTFHGALKLARHQIYAHSPHPCSPVPASSKPAPARTQCGALKTRKPFCRSKHSRVCQACSRSFHSPGLLQKHRCIPRYVQCSSCGTYFGSHSQFHKHKSQDKCSNAWKTIGQTVAQVVSEFKTASVQRANPASDLQTSDSAPSQGFLNPL